MKHGNRYRTIPLSMRDEKGADVVLSGSFLIGPVQQPILSMGKLEDEARASLHSKDRVLKILDSYVPVGRVIHSYHLPVGVEAPKDEGQLRLVRQVKMIRPRDVQAQDEG